VAALEAREVKQALTTKMHAKVTTKRGGHDYYIICDEAGRELASTSFSRGANETLGSGRVSDMWKQLHLDSEKSLADLVRCPLSRHGALEMMSRNYPPGTLKRS
jgi:hypothetical protein